MRKQVPVRIEEELLKEIKKMLIDRDIKFQDYVLQLIVKDMEDRKNGK